MALVVAARSREGRALNGTLHWSEPEHAWLEGSHASRETRRRAERLAAELTSVLAPLTAHDPTFFGDEQTAGAGGDFSAPRMKRLIELISSHAVGHTRAGEPLLLPLPLLRYAHDGAARIVEQAAGGAVQLVARRRIRAGEEITLDAANLLPAGGRGTRGGRSSGGIGGDKGAGYDHAMAMARQGDPGVTPSSCLASTSLTRAEGLGAVALHLRVDEDDPLLAEKELLLSKGSLSASGEAFTLRESRAPPPELIAYARLAVLQRHETEALLAAASSGADAEMPLRREPLSAENEDAAFRFVAVRIERLLAAYPTTVEEDEYELAALVRRGVEASDMWSRRGAAVATALLEKRALNAALGTLHAQLHAYLSQTGATSPPTAGSAAGGRTEKERTLGKRRGGPGRLRPAVTPRRQRWRCS